MTAFVLPMCSVYKVEYVCYQFSYICSYKQQFIYFVNFFDGTSAILFLMYRFQQIMIS